MARRCTAPAASLRELYTVCEDGLVRVWTLPNLQQVNSTVNRLARGAALPPKAASTIGRDLYCPVVGSRRGFRRYCTAPALARSPAALFFAVRRDALQTFELESPQDPPLRVAAHPTQRVLALGFESGAVRVLAVEGPAVWMEANHHRHSITGLWFVDAPSSAAQPVDSSFHPSFTHQQQPRKWPARDGSRTESGIPGPCSLVISLDASGCKHRLPTRAPLEHEKSWKSGAGR